VHGVRIEASMYLVLLAHTCTQSKGIMQDNHGHAIQGAEIERLREMKGGEDSLSMSQLRGGGVGKGPKKTTAKNCRPSPIISTHFLYDFWPIDISLIVRKLYYMIDHIRILI
jgi:hypothetical protein